MKDTQTPRNKDIAHRRPKDSPSSKSISEQFKKPQKVPKKSLNSDFASVSEESLNESLIDVSDFSVISQVVCDTNLINESLDSLESSITSDNQSSFTPDEASRVFDATPISTITSLKDESVNLLAGHSKEIRSNSSVDDDVVLNMLKEARIHVSSLNDVAASSKKYLDALIKAHLRDHYALPYEGDETNAVLSKRVRAVVICFVVWLITMTTIIIRFSGTQSYFSVNAPPT